MAEPTAADRNRKCGVRMVLVTVVALVATSLGIAPGIAFASFTVTTTDDVPDANPADGACDDGAGRCSIRAAVEEANATGGATEITIPAGTYTISGTIAVTSDVTLLGAGVADTQLRPGVDGNMFELVGGASFALHDTDVDAANGTGRRDAALTVVSGPDASVFLTDVHVRNNAWTAMFAEGGASDRVHVEVVRSQFTNVEYPIFFAEGGDQHLDVRESAFVDSGYSAVFIDTVSGAFTIADSEIIDTAGAGIEAWNDQTSPARGTELTVLRTRIAGSTGTFASGVSANGGYVGQEPTMVIDVVDSEITENDDFGLYLDGDVTVERSTISRNGSGGGLLEGPVLVREATFSDNTGFGAELNRPEYPAEVVNSTFSGNQGYAGLAVWKDAALVRNVTITGTTDPSEWDEGAGLATSSDGVVVQNAVIAGNEVDCEDGTFFSSSHTVDSDGTCALTGPGDQSGVDALLGPIADNGGPTWTHAPLPGSPLLDRGDDATCPAADQRGVVRPADGDGDGTATCDVGAVEAGGQFGPGELTIRWEGATARRGLLRPDGGLDVEVTGPAGAISATADVDVISWYPDGDPTAPLLDTPIAATVAVELTEVAAGQYTGTLPLDGVAEVHAIGAVVGTDDGAVVGETTERLPVGVAGGLTFDVALDTPAWTLPGAELWVRSAANRDGDTLATGSPDVVSTRWLQPGDDYTLQPVDDQGRAILASTGPVVVRAGLVDTVPVTGTPHLWLPFSVALHDPNGEPLAGAKVTVVDHLTGDEVAKATTGADGTVAAVAASPDVTIRLDPLALPFAAVEQDVTLTEWDETLVIAPPVVAPTATVSGIVEHPHRPPVAGARVTLTSLLPDGRSFTTATRAGEDGRYSASAFHGEVTVRVDEPRAGRAEGTATVVGDTTVDLMLDGPAIGTLAVDLRTRMAGDLAFTSLPLDGTTGVHFRMYVTDHAGKYLTKVRSNLVDVPMRNGESLRVCADGREAQLPATCVDVPVPPTLDPEATIELSQAGAVAGTLSWTAPIWFEGERYTPLAETKIFRIEDDGSRRYVRSEQATIQTELLSETPQQATFDVGLFDNGTYELRFRVDHMVFGSMVDNPPYRGTDHARVEVEVADGTALLLGDVPLQSGGLFAESPGSGTSMSPTAVLPGETIRLRVAAQNDGDTAIDNARLRLELPVGTTLVPDSVMLDGETASSTVIDGVLEVPVGTIAVSERTVVNAWVTVPSDIASDVLWTQGSVVHGTDEEVTELLGSGVTAVHRLTLEHATHSADLEVPVWGRAEPNSAVEVLVDGLVSATTTASPGGAWSATVTLPYSPLPRDFALQATGTLAGQPVTSGVGLVTYDPDQPVLERAVVWQPTGRVIEIDTTSGVERFPYVWVPGRVNVDLGFSDPSRVEKVTVEIGPPGPVASSGEQTASLDPATGLHRSSVRPSWEQLGELRARWSTKPAQLDLAPSMQQDPWTPEQLRAYLRPPFNTFMGLATASDASAGTVQATGSLPELDDAAFVIDVTSQPEEYEATPDEIALAQGAGVEMYDVQMDLVESPDEVLLTTSVFIPDTALNKGGSVAPTSAPAGTVTGDGQVHAAAATQVATAGVRVGFKMAFEGVGKLDDLLSALGAGGPYKNLAALVDRAATLCSPDRANLYRERADRIARDVAIFEVVKLAISLTAGAIAPATMGFGTLALWFIGYAYGKAVDHRNGERIAQLEKDIQNDPECAAPTPPPPTPERPCDVQVWFDACEIFADPTWIYDPSGYVYELFLDTPLEGVQATLQHAPSPGGPWEIWDAEWYLQDNPLLTDEQGYYGWDVPEGWWRVRWDADGYATAYSEPLEVLPPRFNVNASLERLAGPTLGDVAAVGGASTIDVTFESWMLASWLDEVTVTVTDGHGDPVAATVTAVDTRTAPDFGDVTRQLAVDLGGPLAVGDVYTVTIDRTAQTYAGVPSDDDLVTEVTVAAAPGEDPPADDPPGDDPPPDDPVTEDPISADLGVAKSAGRATTTVGELVPFTVSVTNAGPDQANGVVMTDPLPDAVTFVTVADGACTYDPASHRLRADIGELPAGASETCRYDVLIDEAGTIRNTAAVSATTSDPNPDNDRATAEITATARSDIAQRLYGKTRIETAIATSRAIYADGEAGAVVLARADLFPDALTGAALAAASRAPLLLTTSTELLPAVQDEIQRVLAPGGTVHLLGGDAALSPAVAAPLADLGYRTHRYAGTDRFHTATLVAAAVPTPAAVFIATGRDFADALAASAAAASRHAVILLTDGDRRVPATDAFLAQLGDVPQYAIGGPAARAHPEAVPLVGATRVETAVTVAKQFFDTPTAVGIATAWQFPDAVTGGTHAARHVGPMLLTHPSALPDTVAEFLRNRSGVIEVAYVYGGPAAVDDRVLTEIGAAGR